MSKCYLERRNIGFFPCISTCDPTGTRIVKNLLALRVKEVSTPWNKTMFGYRLVRDQPTVPCSRQNCIHGQRWSVCVCMCVRERSKKAHGGMHWSILNQPTTNNHNYLWFPLPYRSAYHSPTMPICVCTACKRMCVCECACMWPSG